jgi:transcriptional regulator with XRE-family HTH domain
MPMSSDILSKFGHKVRQKRLSLGISQEDLAELAGVHRTYVGMIERGEKNITLRNIEKFAKALGMSINDLMKM